MIKKSTRLAIKRQEPPVKFHRSMENGTSFILRVLVVSLLTCSSASLKAQTNGIYMPKVNNLPTSPEAALLERFGEIPVGHYTGTAKISIQLYVIKESGFEIPITLNYHSSGIKVSDEATWVGLGWDLSPGGAIIQEVRGIRDAYDNNLNSSSTQYTAFKNRIANAGSIGSFKYLKQVGRAGYDFNGCPHICENGECIPSQELPAPEPPNSEPLTLIGSLQLGNGDPDIYHYNFGGYSGKFYINPENDQIVLMDKSEDIKFALSGENAIYATTLDGTKYSFEIVEVASEDGIINPLVSQRSGRTFKLNSVQFSNGRFVTFTYQSAHLSTIQYTQTSMLATSSFAPYPPISQPPVISYNQSDIKILTKITTSDAVLNFNLESRDDIIANGTEDNKRLKSIDILSSETNQKIRTFEFGYSYFPYNLTGAPSDAYITSHLDAFGKRLKLDQVKEIGYNDNGVANTQKPPYVFDYNLSGSLPLKVSFAKDFWGYYNGAANTILLPDLKYFEYPDIYKTNTNGTPFQYNYVGANRYANNAFSTLGMLKKILYPTGGYTEFEYESNSFTNQFIPDKDKLDLLYKNKHIEDQNLVTNTVGSTFQLANTTKIYFDNDILDGFIPNMASGYSYQQMSPSYIEFLKVNMTNGIPVVTVLKRWDLSTVLQAEFDANHGKQWHEEILVEYDPNPNVYYRVNVFLPDNLTNNSYGSVTVRSHFYYYDNTGVDVSFSNACGIRVKSIRNYSGAGNLTGTKSYKYFDGKLLNRFEPIKVRNIWAFLCTPQGLGECQCPGQYQSPTTGEASISSQLVKEGGTAIGYGKVEETNLANDNIDNNGKNAYEFLNFENLYSTWYPAVVNFKNGLLSKQSTYNKEGNLLLEKINTYVDLNNGINCYYGLQILQNFVGNYDPNEAGTGLPDMRSKFSYLATPILSEFNKLQSVQTKQYAGGNVLNTTESYTYNAQGKLKTTSSTNSKAEELVSKIYYVNDGMISDNEMTYGMTYAGMQGVPVYTEQYQGGALLTTEKTVYKPTSFSVNGISTMMPKYIYAAKGGNSLERKITYDQYDEKGNLLQYTVENENPVSFVWNSNKTLPLAKIENASYASLLSLPNGLSSDFRTSLPNARVTTYNYKPLIGVSWITDPNNKTMLYEYDAFGRLTLVRDWNNHIVKKICYNYAGQTENCNSQ